MATTADRLRRICDALTNDGSVNYVGVAPNGSGGWRVDLSPSLDPTTAAAQQAHAQSVIAGLDLTDATLALWLQGSATRTLANALLSDHSDPARLLLRAVGQVLLDQINTIRAALVPPLAAITWSQAVTAIQNKVNSGSAD